MPRRRWQPRPAASSSSPDARPPQGAWGGLGRSGGGAGDGLLSRALSGGVPSTLQGLTAVFGMGTGVAPALWSPAIGQVSCNCLRPARAKRAAGRACGPRAAGQGRRAGRSVNGGVGAPGCACTAAEAWRVGRQSMLRLAAPHIGGKSSRTGDAHRYARSLSPGVHGRPHDGVVSPGPSVPSGGMGRFISGTASHLDAFSGYPCRSSLPGAAPGGTAGTRADRPTRSSRTRVRAPQPSSAHDGYRPNCLTTF